jgi:hypothetical protein
MLPIILTMALFAPALASKGSSAWYYTGEPLRCSAYFAKRLTGENCTVINDTENPNHDEWSIKFGVNIDGCWKNEYEGFKDGARRRSIRIDTPAEGKEDDLDHCLWMYKNGDKTCSGQSFNTMSFSQNSTSVSLYLTTIEYEAHTIKLQGQSAIHLTRATKIPMKATSPTGSPE